MVPRFDLMPSIALLYKMHILCIMFTNQIQITYEGKGILYYNRPELNACIDLKRACRCFCWTHGREKWGRMRSSVPGMDLRVHRSVSIVPSPVPRAMICWGYRGLRPNKWTSSRELDGESSYPVTWALLLHDGFQPLRPVGKALDGDSSLYGPGTRASNVVKQTPSSLRARTFPLAR